MFLTWLKAFYLMRLFESTSFFVRLVFETFKDIFYGLLVFLVILMMFGNVLIVLSQDREPLFHRFFEEDESNYINAFLNMYEITLGTWTYDVIFDENNPDEIDSDATYGFYSLGAPNIQWYGGEGDDIIYAGS